MISVVICKPSNFTVDVESGLFQVRPMLYVPTFVAAAVGGVPVTQSKLSTDDVHKLETEPCK